MCESANANRYFVDVNGVIFTLFASGNHNFPGDLKVEEKTPDRGFAQVLVLGEHENGDNTGGRLIEDEYVLWGSLTDLATTNGAP